MGLNLGHEWKEKRKKRKDTHTLVLKMTNLASTHDLEKMIIEILEVITKADLVQGYSEGCGFERI